MHQTGHHGEWQVQVSGQHPAPEEQVRPLGGGAFVGGASEGEAGVGGANLPYLLDNEPRLDVYSEYYQTCGVVSWVKYIKC